MFPRIAIRFANATSLSLAACFLFSGCATNGAIYDDSEPDAAAIAAPQGPGWVPVVAKLNPAEWEFQPENWKIDPDGSLHGISAATPQHHYMYSKKSYADFELHADFKMTGYNSGICIRLEPTSFDNAPGYQVDMGDGYWGSLWEEKGRGMVSKFPDAEVAKTLHRGEWNHYYVIARGHHIRMWLNGRKTVDIDDEPGRLTGKIGFQLAHTRATNVIFKNIVIREIE